MIKEINYREIFDAWLISFKPNDKQKKLAEERLEICKSCINRKELLKNNKWSAYCGLCNCPLSKKVFSRMYNPCPADKWESIDIRYMERQETKKDSSLI